MESTKDEKRTVVIMLDEEEYEKFEKLLEKSVHKTFNELIIKALNCYWNLLNCVDDNIIHKEDIEGINCWIEPIP